VNKEKVAVHHPPLILKRAPPPSNYLSCVAEHHHKWRKGLSRPGSIIYQRTSVPHLYPTACFLAFIVVFEIMGVNEKIDVYE